MYSVQQIKFECLAYIKEYGGDPLAWRVLACEGLGEAELARCGVDHGRDIWMCKPALSLRAAMTVVQFLRERMGVAAPQHDPAAPPEARFVLLYRPGGSPAQAAHPSAPVTP